MTESEPREYGDLPAEYEENVFDSPIRTCGVWPTIERFLPDVADRRVLDAACGPGLLSSRLADRGADVTGIDASEGMLRYARDHYGDRASFLQADLRDSLAFDDDTFDVVVSQFTLEFVTDWFQPAREFRRVLTPDGTVVVSINHPFVEYLMTRYGELPDFERLFDADGQPNVVTDGERSKYFEVEPYETNWDDDGETTARDVTFYRRSLEAVITPLLENDLAVTDVAEIGATPELDAEYPELADGLRDEPPMYLCLRAEPRATTGG